MNAHAPNAFRQWWDLGYRSIIPIIPPGAPLYDRSVLNKKLLAGQDARGKAPGFKTSDDLWMGLRDWQTHQTTEADIDAWHAMGAGVGLPDDGGLVLLDIDATDEATADRIEADALKMLGPAPMRVGSWPKRALVYRIDETLPFMLVTFKGSDAENRIEILAKPKQMVVHGIHPKTGKPYEWRRPIVPRDQLTPVSRSDVEAFLELQAQKLPAAEVRAAGSATDRATVDQDLLKGDIELVRQAVAATPNTQELFPHYDDMVVMGQAIHAATIDSPDDGFEIYDEWASRWPGDGYSFERAQRDWGTFRSPHAVGAAFLYAQASRHGGEAGTRFVVDRWFDASPVPSGSLFDVSISSSSEATKLFSFTSFSEAANTALSSSARPLIKGLLDQGAMTILYGESNSGKTFVALDLAYHIAAGLAWGGMKTEAAAVVYVAAEGGAGARKRAAALRSRYGAAPAGFHFLLQPVNLLRADADLGPLIASIKAIGLPVGLVVIDTLSRAMSGGDENASTDMGAMVRHLDVLRSATGAHLLTVHHSGKDRARGARGHSLLRAATDTEIEIADRVFSVTKQRDLDKSFTSAFELDVVTLGVDGEGDPVTSCTVRLVAKHEAVVGEPTPVEARVLLALDGLSALLTDESTGVKLADVARHFAEGADKMSTDGVRMALKELVVKRLVVKTGRGLYAKNGQVVCEKAKENRSFGSPPRQNVFD